MQFNMNPLIAVASFDDFSFRLNEAKTISKFFKNSCKWTQHAVRLDMLDNMSDGPFMFATASSDRQLFDMRNWSSMLPYIFELEKRFPKDELVLFLRRIVCELEAKELEQLCRETKRTKKRRL